MTLIERCASFFVIMIAQTRPENYHTDSVVVVVVNKLETYMPTS